jgi:biotin-(acetyl-CoA carboxylase) ligase
MSSEPSGRAGWGQAFDLPPPFRLVALREVGDAFGHASSRALELGAGTLVSVGRFDLAEFAVVLEPEESLSSARLVFYAGMVALCDSLAALAPPEKPIAVNWPDAVVIDGGLVGGGRLAWPPGIDECTVPDWLVFGATIRTVSMSGAETGLNPLVTALEDEGFGDSDSGRLLSGFARHLMMTMDRWREGGSSMIAKDYISKLKSPRDVQIQRNGDLVFFRAGEPVEYRTLCASLEEPTWLDRKTAGPRL